MDKIELWLKLYQEANLEMRHQEQQRGTMTGFSLALCAGILTFMGFDKTFGDADLPAAVFLTIVGAFGCIFSAKHYERWYVSMIRAHRYRDAIAESIPDSQVKVLQQLASKAAKQKFGILHDIRLGLFWVALHALITTFGLLLVVRLVGVGSES